MQTGDNREVAVSGQCSETIDNIFEREINFDKGVTLYNSSIMYTWFSFHVIQNVVFVTAQPRAQDYGG